jgi:nucleotide-binding universal stress UspA family protein
MHPIAEREMRNLDSTARVRFANILFTTDLSADAERALPYALEIARRYNSTIYASHIVLDDRNPLVPPANWAMLAEQSAKYREDGRRRLEELLRDLPHEIIFEKGEIVVALAELISKKKIDLVVLSTHGRSGIEKALLGSVAEKIFRQTLRPVLTVGPRASGVPKPRAGLNRIVFATDFSAESVAGAPYAISLAREHRAQLILLHCLEDGGDVKTLLHSLHEIVPFGADLRSEPDCIVERGHPADKILEVAEGHGADMIVLGVHGTDSQHGRKTQFNHSGTYKIVTRATCPVLTVRG